MKTKIVLAVLMSILLPLQAVTFNAAFATKTISMPDQYYPTLLTQSTQYPNVGLKWMPDKPYAGQEITFTISFKKPSDGSLQPNIDYKFAIAKDGSNVFTVIRHSSMGSDTIKQKLDSDGKYIVTVTITGIDLKKVDPKTSDFSLVVVKAQTQKQTPQMQQQKDTRSNIMPQMREVKKPLRVGLVDEKGKHLGAVDIFQKNSHALITVWLRPVGLDEHISAWLVAGPHEQITKKWSQVDNISVINIGHDEPTRHVNVFNKMLSFIPASGDKIVVTMDDCSTGHCKQTTNNIATATLKM